MFQYSFFEKNFLIDRKMIHEMCTAIYAQQKLHITIKNERNERNAKNKEI